MTEQKRIKATCLDDAIITVGNFGAFIDLAREWNVAPDWTSCQRDIVLGVSRVCTAARQTYSNTNLRYAASVSVVDGMSMALLNFVFLCKADQSGKSEADVLDLVKLEEWFMLCETYVANGQVAPPHILDDLRPSFNPKLAKSIDFLLLLAGNLPYVTVPLSDLNKADLLRFYASLRFVSHSLGFSIDDLCKSALVQFAQTKDFQGQFDSFAETYCEKKENA